MRKQESNHKKMMKLYKGMINMHGHALDVQCVDNELNIYNFILLICISRKVQIYWWCIMVCFNCYL